ncbi:MAG: beta-lactamase family protein [Lentisphaeria bacterium]|nr:beta-lactamase family protein [Lentisphaeria bacterium]
MELAKKLQDVLDRSVESGEECGCQLAVYRYGELLYDLASGYTTPEQTKKVNTDTLFPVFSVGKGICTTLLLKLKDQGKFEFDDLVSKYWKGYEVNGKEMTTIRNVLSHRAGLYDVTGIPWEDLFVWEKICKWMEEGVPGDTIGGMHHYHALTYGVLAGHLAELIDGRPFHQLLKEEILDPLQLDHIFFGISREDYENNVAFIDGSIAKPEDTRPNYNQFAVLGGVNPSSNGCVNARNLAKMYASLIGNGVNGCRLVSEKTIDEATRICRAPEDDNLNNWDKFGLGYALCGPQGNYGRMFGHGGACGAEGFADKETGYAIGFTKNKVNRTHPVHPTRNEISKVLGLPERIW